MRSIRDKLLIYSLIHVPKEQFNPVFFLPLLFFLPLFLSFIPYRQMDGPFYYPSVFSFIYFSFFPLFFPQIFVAFIVPGILSRNQFFKL